MCHVFLPSRYGGNVVQDTYGRHISFPVRAMEQDVLYVPERLTFRIIILNLLNSKQECWQRCLNYKYEG